MKAAKVVDPAKQGQDARDQVRFGATVELADEDDNRRTLTIVGDDETDASAGKIGWSAPIARALIGARVGDERIVRLPAGEKSYEVMAIRYPAADLGGAARLIHQARRLGRHRFGPGVGNGGQRGDRRGRLVVAVDHLPRRPARIGILAQVVERLGISGVADVDEIVAALNSPPRIGGPLLAACASWVSASTSK